MLRLFLVLALTSCTFTHAVRSRHDHAPSIQLSPAMAKLDHAQQSSPWWTAAGDMALVMGGFAAGPMADGRVPASDVQTVNIAGFAVTGLVLMSLTATLALWGRL